MLPPFPGPVIYGARCTNPEIVRRSFSFAKKESDANGPQSAAAVKIHPKTNERDVNRDWMSCAKADRTFRHTPQRLVSPFPSSGRLLGNHSLINIVSGCGRRARQHSTWLHLPEGKAFWGQVLGSTTHPPTLNVMCIGAYALGPVPYWSKGLFGFPRGHAESGRPDRWIVQPVMRR